MDRGDDVANGEILHIQQRPKPHLGQIQYIGLMQRAHPHVRELRPSTGFIMTAVRNNSDSKQATFTQRYTGTADMWRTYEKHVAIKNMVECLKK